MHVYICTYVCVYLVMKSAYRNFIKTVLPYSNSKDWASLKMYMEDSTKYINANKRENSNLYIDSFIFLDFYNCVIPTFLQNPVIPRGCDSRMASNVSFGPTGLCYQITLYKLKQSIIRILLQIVGLHKKQSCCYRKNVVNVVFYSPLQTIHELQKTERKEKEQERISK